MVLNFSLTCRVRVLLACAVVVLDDVVPGTFLDVDPLVTLDSFVSNDAEA